jgi:integrase
LYALLAIALAVETGMRLQEIFNLTFGDILPLDNQRIRISKSKTDHQNDKKGRTIVMSKEAREHLFTITSKRMLLPDIDLDSNLFPMNKKAFKQTWETIKHNAGIADLTCHDLRHEAGSRFDELGLTKAEHDLMMGHKNRDMASRYTHTEELKLRLIEEKMDKYHNDRKDKPREEVGLAVVYRPIRIKRRKDITPTPSPLSDTE